MGASTSKKDNTRTPHSDEGAEGGSRGAAVETPVRPATTSIQAPTSGSGVAPVGGRATLVPTVFRWMGGGKSVFVSGSFDGWATRIPLAKSTSDFATIIDVPPGTHEYKFIVDGTWQHAPDQPAMEHTDGNRNNVVNVSVAEVFSDEEWIDGDTGIAPEDENEDDEGWGQVEPDAPDQYARPPKSVPPHLMRCILNTWQSKDNAAVLPIPHHTQISHLYLQRGSQPHLMSIATTVRYRRKFVTTVYNAPAV
ncbi:carbohydrate-binding module family 48 protein [Thecamonas trahens ATCC 50062]|uniref:Carbohydrate-binding module family 48 protein n=1 Tax=Thecamonas trahens ATCC 50062 TaxID=461836 RepID=A0A0L0DPK9_THETB|nr:carbohydrate-binding module family 48 protein [Thecamonas trahens ATCC 50062]KNC54244.1 carbohydrate-binding module family 48 protein [Thecamonas trahens ATCC 50062]|eukprot:XP_013753881.1 carbohydrate-binding module family 48 protein [Thecamonas trahens ATCC 50062]